MKKRMIKSIIGGAVLGVFCIIGAYIRSGNTATYGELFSLWYNRIIIGLVIGAPWSKTTKIRSLMRGALLGLLVSFAFYSTTGFQDHVSFVAGMIYGFIIEAFLIMSEKNDSD